MQSLINKLEPLFPEIAGMSVSSDGLVEAIHGCELRLVHAHEAVQVRPYARLLFIVATSCMVVVCALVYPLGSLMRDAL